MNTGFTLDEIKCTAEWLADRSGYPGEGLCMRLCAGVEAYSRNRC